MPPELREPGIMGDATAFKMPARQEAAEPKSLVPTPRQQELKEAMGEEAFAVWEARCNALISQKIARRSESENEDAAEPEPWMIADIQRSLKEILATEVISLDFFDALLDRITIAPENRRADNGNFMMLGAEPEDGEIIIYPRYFEPDAKFHPEHVLAHDLGELMHIHADNAEYSQYRADPALALDGNYVDETRAKLGDAAAEREAYCETFADVIRSKTGVETAARRYLRYANRVEVFEQLDSPEGEQRADYLMSESMNLRTIILQQNETLLPQLQERAAARRAAAELPAEAPAVEPVPMLEASVARAEEVEEIDVDDIIFDEIMVQTMQPEPQPVPKRPRNKVLQVLCDFFDVK